MQALPVLPETAKGKRSKHFPFGEEPPLVPLYTLCQTLQKQVGPVNEGSEDPGPAGMLVDNQGQVPIWTQGV